MIRPYGPEALLQPEEPAVHFLFHRGKKNTSFRSDKREEEGDDDEEVAFREG